LRDGFTPGGSEAGGKVGNVTTRPTYVLNDLVTFIKGSHTIKTGFEYRNIGGNLHTNRNPAGTLALGRGATGVLGQNSGSPIASFLLGAVDNGNSDFRTSPNTYVRQSAYVVHAGDTWRMNRKLTVNYGLRWDVFTPAKEKYNNFSFFDPVGANPTAGGRPGRLAFAGEDFGAASFGANYPEKTYWKAFQPRLGLTYSVNPKPLVRAGWGIFFNKAFYPGWGGGIAQEGFTTNVPFNRTRGGSR